MVLGRALAALAVVAAPVTALLLACAATPRKAAEGARVGSGAPAAGSGFGVIRLLDQLADASFVRTAGADPFTDELGVAAPADLLRFESFTPEEPFPGAWRSRAFVTAAFEGGAAACAAIAPRSSRPVRVEERTTVAIPANDLLMATAAATPGAHYLLRAWVRPLQLPQVDDGREPTAPSLAYAPLDHRPAEGDAFADDLKQHVAEYARRPRETPLPIIEWMTGSGELHELRALVRPYAGRKALAFAVNGGDCGVELDQFELRRLTAEEALALSGDETVELPSHPRRRRVEFDLETWDCVALPTGITRFEVTVPTGAPFLDFALAALPDEEPARARATLELALFAAGREPGEGEESLTWSLGDGELASGQWHSQRVPLAGFAGQVVTVRFKASGPALLGAPTVVATRTTAGAPAAPAPRRPNLIVLSLDTLRADHVGCYGGKVVATPAIDALAARGTRFARVFSPASYTLPTHLALLSGQDPLVHETVAATDPMDPLRTLPLAARLREAGWRTGAFTAGGLVHPRYGFGVGFDRYSIRDPGGVVGLHRRIGDVQDDDAQPGEDRMGAVLDWITAGGDAPFFLFLHTYLVHNYRPHQPWLDRTFGGPRPSPEELRTLRQAASGGDAAANQRLRELYAASLAQADAEIVGRLLATLDTAGLRERTIVALLSDHGEEFLEHGMVGHGDELWHTLTEVPWIVAGPGVPEGAVREEPVVLADVAPTLAGLLPLSDDPRVLAVDRFSPDAIEAAGDGEAITLSLRRIADRPDQDALVLWPWKLVRRRTAEKPWPVALYELDEDPGETRDRAADLPERTAGMIRRLDARLAELERAKQELPSRSGPRRFDLSPELERMLDQLGYANAIAADEDDE
ncbi:MAG: sulfatase [Planctomycetes bacterium]|nr:sulfatase [Planctomycetota bacterium]